MWRGITSLILSIVSLFFCFFCWWLGIIAIAIGLMGIYDKKYIEQYADDKKLCYVGILVSIISIFVFFVFIAILIFTI